MKSTSIWDTITSTITGIGTGISSIIGSANNARLKVKNQLVKPKPAPIAVAPITPVSPVSHGTMATGTVVLWAAAAFVIYKLAK